MDIEVVRNSVGDRVAATPSLIASLRKSARLLSTHFSTQIEGNRLTVDEVEKVVIRRQGFPGRKRDQDEVLNHYRAAEKVDQLAQSSSVFEEKEIAIIHGLVMDGSARPTPYRDGQNVIRDGASGGIVYMPPEAQDVAGLMGDLVSWINHQIEVDELPVPVIAALAHYQFATIHPWFDGNGRTARLLVNLILHRCGYGMNGVYSLEEYYARNLGSYYEALSVGESHNYYMGRAEADVSGFVEFFCLGMADSFSKIAENIENSSADASPPKDQRLLRTLSPLQRQALGLFADNRVITSKQLGEYLSVSPRKARGLCQSWLEDKFLEVENPSKKARSYRLANKFETRFNL